MKIKSLLIIPAISILAAAPGCLSNDLASHDDTAARAPAGDAQSVATEVTPSPAPAGPSYRIGAVTFSSSGGGGAVGATLSLDSAASTAPLSTSCAPSGTKACLCQFSWSEKNDTGVTSSLITRRVIQPMTLVQPYLAQCPAPEVYATEIPDGTTIRVTIINAPQNSLS